MEIQKIAISKIKPNPDNPRIIKNDQFKRLVKSLKDFPEMLELREVVVDENYTVLGGNMRLKALQEIGEKEIIVKIAEGLTEEQKREFVIKDNAAFGEWNMDDLANEWGDLPLADWGIDLPEFKDDEKKDLSENFSSIFSIEINFENAEDQETAYNKFIKMGYLCKILTL